METRSHENKPGFPQFKINIFLHVNHEANILKTDTLILVGFSCF